MSACALAQLFGAGFVAARQLGAAAIVDPRPHAVGRIAELYRRYSHVGAALPAVGYSPEEIRDLEATIRATECDSVVIATPADLGHVLRLDRPATRVRYELADHGTPTLADEIRRFLADRPSRCRRSPPPRRAGWRLPESSRPAAWAPRSTPRSTFSPPGSAC